MFQIRSIFIFLQISFLHSTQVSTELFMNDVKMAENTMTNNLFFLHLQKRCYYILFLWLNLPQKYRQGTLKSYEDSKHEADLELNPVETMPTIKVKTPHTYRIFFS